MTGVKQFVQRTRVAAGFSVIELLVVVTIFAIGSLAIASTYINFTRLHRRVANAETLGQELRFASELIVRALRNGLPDYPPLPDSAPHPSHEILLKTQNGSSAIRIVRFTSVESPCSGLNADCLALSLDGGASWAPITGKNVNIDRFDVYVTPEQSPYEPIGLGAYQNDRQPIGTFVIDASYKTPQPLEKASLSVQTSVSSRLYMR